jgi:glutaredoxin
MSATLSSCVWQLAAQQQAAGVVTRTSRRTCVRLCAVQCPFCHRVLLTLETKSIPYKTGLIDFAHKPEW